MWQGVDGFSSCYILQQTGTVTRYNGPDEEYDVASTVIDRSFLGDEMAEMCAKLPIYRVKMSTAQRQCYCQQQCAAYLENS